MHHAKEVTGVCAQWVNSYKRLVPGYEAPVYITWAHRNRSNMVRVPMYKPGKEMATRIEFRAPDPACNPYLAFAVLINAGLSGIDNKYPIPDPIDADVYSMSAEEREKLGIESLPGSLNEAIEVMESSDLVRQALGDHIFEKFIQNKKIEWDAYRSQVHAYELDRYLTVL
jgi:glutamine synthetase